jgi:hypothetical protein
MNVLLTCVGLRVDVVQAFRDALARPCPSVLRHRR